MKYTDDDFEGNIRVTVSPKEVRVWLCDKNGCKFRFKASGNVVRNNNDIVVSPETNNPTKSPERG